MHTTMRSQDLWLGFPYDVFTFTVLHELMAGWVGAELGEYRHTVDSLHLYSTNWDAASTLTAQPTAEDDGAPELWHGTTSNTSSPLSCEVTRPPSPARHGRTLPQCCATNRLWRAGARDTALAMAADLHGPLGLSSRDWYAHLAIPAVAS